MEEDIDLGINPNQLNETESRLITLLFTLLKFQHGLSLEQIRSYMPDHYNNENLDSDQKKLQRDMDALNDLGFSAIFDKSTLVYRIKLDTPESKLKFNESELKSISLALINQNKDGEYARSIYSLAQKIFGSNWNLYPFFPGEKTQSKDDRQDNETIDSILHAIKSKIALRITYERQYGIPKEKDIDPIQILRKNSTDLYLYAFDRKKREYRYYLLPCITKIFKLDTPFLLEHRIRPEDRPNHPLEFPNHNPVTVRIRSGETGRNALAHFLDRITIAENEDWIEFSTTNAQALFPILIRWKTYIEEIQPDSIRDQYKKFLEDTIALHSQS